MLTSCLSAVAASTHRVWQLGGEVTVTRLLSGGETSGEWTLPSAIRLDSAVLVVSAAAPEPPSLHRTSTHWPSRRRWPRWTCRRGSANAAAHCGH